MNTIMHLGNLIQELELLGNKPFLVNSNKGRDLLRLFDKSEGKLNLLKETYATLFDDIHIDENFSVDHHHMNGDYYSDTRIEQLIITLKTCLKIIKDIPKKDETISKAPLDILEQIARNFSIAVRQLKNRRDGKASFDISDEYDVQDIFKCFLYLFFDEVKKEDNVPDFAGSNSRIDFILPKEQIGIEIKKTRKGLDSKKIGEELIIDKARYKKHPDCKFLFCFVYDNEHQIKSAISLENELSEESNSDFGMRVRIFPK